MSDKEALNEFMRVREFGIDELAKATGDTYSSIYFMATGRRKVNDSFKWRFAQAFGWHEAERVFGVAAEPVTREPA